jgi:large subunit ribosomal protein L10
MASEKSLNLKKETVNEIRNKISDSETVVLFTYQGLTVADIIKLRRKLREVNAEVKIYKNTLVKLALDDLKLDLTEFLEGPNALLFSKNLLEAIKVLDNFAKDNKSITIKTGIIKGNVVSVDTINEYASVPPMETLLSMLAGGMLQHVKHLAIGLNMYAEKLEENN